MVRRGFFVSERPELARSLDECLHAAAWGRDARPEASTELFVRQFV